MNISSSHNCMTQQSKNCIVFLIFSHFIHYVTHPFSRCPVPNFLPYIPVQLILFTLFTFIDLQT